MDTRNRRLGPWDSLGEIINSINDLENTNVKCTWFESVASGTSGTITPPTGSTILLDQWSAGIDVLVSGISSGVPTFKSVIDTEGALITGTLDAAGAWTISGTPLDGYPISLIYVYRIALSDFNQSFCLESAQVAGINTLSIIGDLADSFSGFPDDYRDQSTITFDDGTRTLTIAPVGDKFSIWVLGNEFVYTSAETQVIPDTEGVHWVYFDLSGVIQVLTNPTEDQEEDLIKRQALVAYILWDATNNVSTLFGDERHGMTMDGATHFYLHEVAGFAYYEGLLAGDITADGDGDLDASATLSLTNGTLFDEDIKYETSDSGQTLSTPAQIPLYYIDGVAGTWRKDSADSFPVKNFVGGDGRLAWNSFSAPNYGQTEATNNDFVLCHIFATNDIDEPIISVQGQDEYNTLGQARDGAEVELLSLQTIGLPAQEFTPLYSIIYQTSTGYSNTPKARIRTNDAGDDYIDWRVTRVGASGGGGSGDVTGPSSATDNAIARFDGATGKVIQDSLITIDDTGFLGLSDGGSSTATIGFDASPAGELQIYNTTVSGVIEIRAKNSGGTLTPCANFNPNGGTTLRSSGNDILLTSNSGLVIYNSGNDVLDINPGSAAVIASRVDAGTIQIEGDKTGGSQAIMFLGDPDGSAYLYYAGTQKLQTQPAGIIVGDGTADGFGIAFNEDDIYLDNLDPDGLVYIRARNAADSAMNNLISGDPDGATGLYHTGIISFSTGSDGVSVYDTSGTDILLYFKSSGDVTQGLIECNAGEFIIYDALNSDYILNNSPGGAVNLYYGGTKKFETTNDGIKVGNGTASGENIFFSSDDFYFDNTDPGGNTYIRNRNAANDANHIAFTGVSDGASSLFFAGVKKLETTSTGLLVGDGTATGISIFYSDDDAYFDNTDPAGKIFIRSRNTADSATNNVFVGNPDGECAIYYAGVKSLGTITGGGIAIGTSVASGFNMSYSADDFYLANSDPAGATVIMNRNAANDNNDVSAVFYPDVGAALYYNNLETFRTVSNGTRIINTGVDREFFQYWSSDNFIIHADASDANTTNMYLYVDHSGSSHIGIIIDGGGAVTLHYDNVAKFNTGSTINESDAHLAPGTDSTYTLGTSEKCWSNIYGDAGVTSCSDRKYKSEIEQTPLGLDFVNALVPVEFAFRKDGKRPKNHTGKYHGILADELEAALIDVGYDPGKFGGLEREIDDSGEVWMGVKYEQLIAPMLKAIQELTLKVKDLEEK